MDNETKRRIRNAAAVLVFAGIFIIYRLLDGGLTAPDAAALIAIIVGGGSAALSSDSSQLPRCLRRRRAARKT